MEYKKDTVFYVICNINNYLFDNIKKNIHYNMIYIYH